MSLLEALILGILQGFAEFLPISSSAHLILVPWWFGWDEPPLVFDVAVHLGTTVAIIAYFWNDWINLAKAGFQILRQRAIKTDNEKTIILIIIATIPAVIAGLLLEPYFESTLSEPAFAAFFLYITALLLVSSEQFHVSDKIIPQMSNGDAAFIGIAQALAIIPGISRSGSTISAGLLRELSRESAARFSFLMATPIILGAGVKQGLDILLGENVEVDASILMIGFLSSAIIGYASISFLLNFIRRQKLYIFAGYCVIFATISLIGIVLS